MASGPTWFPKVLTLYLELGQYPIMASLIRERMRNELFRRGVISQEAFEDEVREKAIQSQRREGLVNPYNEEPPDVWSTRLTIIRDHLTDFYFAYNLPHDLFEELVRETLAKRVPSDEVVLTFHPELAPWDMLFAQGETYEALPPEQRTQVQHHLEEIKVVLIKAMISDHLEYVGIAKEWFSIADIKAVRNQRLGRGKIGGKAAGVVLAECILRKSAGAELLNRFDVPRSWFLGADVFYRFTQFNNLLGFANQKYRGEDEIRAEYEGIRGRFEQGRFPEEIVEGLRSVLDQIGRSPLIVRSSSLLEDSFKYSFAGKYDSYFCPNQGSPKENLRRLIQAISRVYASVYSPDVLVYRRSKGLIDYDERMAILIQEVQGREVGKHFLPDAAGVAFSRNQYRWSPRIDRSSGFLRMVWGLGTRAVEQLGGDYPRLVALSHPDLRPEPDPEVIRRYSQHHVDLIDLEANEMSTLPVSEVIGEGKSLLRWVAQRYRQDNLEDFVGLPLRLDPEEVVITFDGLLRRTEFPALMKDLIGRLERAYSRPVDVEFLALLTEVGRGKVEPRIYLLQCRPQSSLEMAAVKLPTDIPLKRRLFVCRRLVPDGLVQGVRYAIYIPPEKYGAVEGQRSKVEIARLIGRLNSGLAGQAFIMIGPGRWGSVNPDLGVPVTYGDIYNAKALIEIASGATAPEPSYGTHFFQDLVEAKIYPLALALDDPGAEFNRRFFEGSPNTLTELLPQEARWAEVVRLIDVPAAADGAHVELVMNGEVGMAIAYLAENRTS